MDLSQDSLKHTIKTDIDNSDHHQLQLNKVSPITSYFSNWLALLMWKKEEYNDSDRVKLTFFC